MQQCGRDPVSGLRGGLGGQGTPGRPQPGALGQAAAEQVGDRYGAHAEEDPLDVDGRNPLHLAVLDHIGAGRSAVESEASPASFAAVAVLAHSSATTTGDGRRRDDGDAVGLVRLGVHPPGRDGLVCPAQELIELHDGLSSDPPPSLSHRPLAD